MRHPPPHLAAALATAAEAHEAEPGIWQSDAADAGLAQYDTIGGFYDFLGGLDVYHRLVWGVSTRAYRAFAEAAVAACGPGTLLDAACGSMLFTAHAHRANSRCAAIGTDASVKMLRLALARLGSSTNARGVALVHANVLHSPFRSGAFDAVICMHAVHVLDDLSGLLAEMRRILKPGGKLFLTSLLLVESWRDRYLRILCRRGIMAPPRREEEVLAAVRMQFDAEPAASINGSMLFLQVTKVQ